MADTVECFAVKLFKRQRANLETLAAYLWTLPANYPDFEMSDFVSAADPFGREASFAHVACGTAACAVGHGPKAGIAPVAGEMWRDYSERVFISPKTEYDTEDDAWEWCFGAGWARTDNTVHGAAARIEWMLEHGVPYNWYKQKRGESPLCYSTDRGVS